ncbi:hypothetical protein B0H11DRAFT_2225886 [Mycena galericulata]|nr:hypothetical protein B0H11DRAFT_2225886 [Mycena galericulata]
MKKEVRKSKLRSVRLCHCVLFLENQPGWKPERANAPAAFTLSAPSIPYSGPGPPSPTSAHLPSRPRESGLATPSVHVRAWSIPHLESKSKGQFEYEQEHEHQASKPGVREECNRRGPREGTSIVDRSGGGHTSHTGEGEREREVHPIRSAVGVVCLRAGFSPASYILHPHRAQPPVAKKTARAHVCVRDRIRGGGGAADEWGEVERRSQIVAVMGACGGWIRMRVRKTKRKGTTGPRALQDGMGCFKCDDIDADMTDAH